MKQFSILVVDDSETDRYLLKRSIQKSELVADIFEAENGQEALDFFTNYDKREELGPNFPPVIIFLDVNMPLLDGFGFLEKFSEIRKEQKSFESSVLILLSSSEQESDKEKALSYDFVRDYIIKGSNGPKKLREMVNKILEDNFTK